MELGLHDCAAKEMFECKQVLFCLFFKACNCLYWNTVILFGSASSAWSIAQFCSPSHGTTLSRVKRGKYLTRSPRPHHARERGGIILSFHFRHFLENGKERYINAGNWLSNKLSKLRSKNMLFVDLFCY